MTSNFPTKTQNGTLQTTIAIWGIYWQPLFQFHLCAFRERRPHCERNFNPSSLGVGRKLVRVGQKGCSPSLGLWPLLLPIFLTPAAVMTPARTRDCQSLVQMKQIFEYSEVSQRDAPFHPWILYNTSQKRFRREGIARSARKSKGTKQNKHLFLHL